MEVVLDLVEVVLAPVAAVLCQVRVLVVHAHARLAEEARDLKHDKFNVRGMRVQVIISANTINDTISRVKEVKPILQRIQINQNATNLNL